MESKTRSSTENVFHHWLASLKFRFSHAVSGAEEHFAFFEVGQSVRKPIEIVLHMSQLSSNSRSMIEGTPRTKLEPLSWNEEIARFYALIGELDLAVTRRTPETELVAETLIQGPLMDITSHIGQLTMLRRLSGRPVDAVNYAQANIPR